MPGRDWLRAMAVVIVTIMSMVYSNWHSVYTSTRRLQYRDVLIFSFTCLFVHWATHVFHLKYFMFPYNMHTCFFFLSKSLFFARLARLGRTNNHIIYHTVKKKEKKKNWNWTFTLTNKMKVHKMIKMTLKSVG